MRDLTIQIYFALLVNHEINDHPLRVIDAELLEKLFQSET